MSAVKKVINSVDSIVDDAAEGLLLSDSYLASVSNIQNVIVRNDIEIIKQGYVTLISGGGSGHEPAHAGFIGHGMLSSAVLGNVFASPSVAQILAAIRVCAGPKGCLLIVKNYTGDRLNFGMAMEKAKTEGLKVMMVIVGDDSALPEGKGITGGRGVAGTLFVHKVAGAAAAEGCTLEQVHAEATAVADKVRSMGVAFTTCTVPGAPPSDRLADSQTYEIGLGIHGEPGREQKKIVEGNETLASEVASVLVEQCMSRLGGHKLAGQPVALMINNLGAIPMLEMLVATKCIIRKAAAMGLKPVRCFVGSFMTSLEMAGLSLSILHLDSNELTARIDSVTTAPAWRPSATLSEKPKCNHVAYDGASFKTQINGGLTWDVAYANSITSAICAKLIELEPELTRCDAICGDGDCGLVMKKGAQHILSAIDGFGTDSASYCDALADAVSASMGGTSGALLELFFRAMANSLVSSESGSNSPLAKAVMGLRAGLDAMMFFGGATRGMRTMLDALIPAVESLEENMGLSVGGASAVYKEVVSKAADAAAAGRDTTLSMGALAGRANYVNEELMQGVPDPGALAIAAAFAAAAAVM
jgi:triose/dihydroxyacetone kinase / FAD-AMP lyase (cyclizing)